MRDWRVRLFIGIAKSFFMTRWFKKKTLISIDLDCSSMLDIKRGKEISIFFLKREEKEKDTFESKHKRNGNRHEQSPCGN